MQKYSKPYVFPKPGDMIFWRDLLNRIQRINVFRYGRSYEISLGANMALREVEQLIEDALKYPNDDKGPWEWHDGLPAGRWYKLKDLIGGDDEMLWFRSEPVLGTDGTDIFECAYWRCPQLQPEGFWKLWPNGNHVKPTFWCPMPKKIPRKAAK